MLVNKFQENLIHTRLDELGFRSYRGLSDFVGQHFRGAHVMVYRKDTFYVNFFKTTSGKSQFQVLQEPVGGVSFKVYLHMIIKNRYLPLESFLELLTEAKCLPDLRDDWENAVDGEEKALNASQ